MSRFGYSGNVNERRTIWLVIGGDVDSPVGSGYAGSICNFWGLGPTKAAPTIGSGEGRKNCEGLPFTPC